MAWYPEVPGRMKGYQSQRHYDMALRLSVFGPFGNRKYVEHPHRR